MENPKNNMAEVELDSKKCRGWDLNPPVSIPFSFKNDSNNFLLSGTRVQTKAFMRHLIERFGEDARLGDVLSGTSPKVHEPKLNKDMRTEVK